LHKARLASGTALVVSGHLIGLSLTGASTVLLVVVCLQYWKSRRALARIEGSRIPRSPAALLASILVVVLGCAVFVVLSIDKK
jgi:hypothetical protein